MLTLTKNGAAVRTFASKEEFVASQLRGTPTQVGGPMTNIGNVAELPQDALLGSPVDNFSVTLVNACLVTKTFIIGDPTTGIGQQLGGTLLNPTACSFDGATPGSGVAAMKAMFGYRPIAIRGFNYQTSSTALQFANKLQQVTADVNGELYRKPVNVAIQRRNNQFDELLMTLSLRTPFTFNPVRAMTLAVLAGETVSLEFDVFMVA